MEMSSAVANRDSIDQTKQLINPESARPSSNASSQKLVKSKDRDTISSKSSSQKDMAGRIVTDIGNIRDDKSQVTEVGAAAEDAFRV